MLAGPPPLPATAMSDPAPTTARADALRRQLIRNVHEVPREPFLRHTPDGTAYDTMTAALAEGTAARKLGAAYDVLAPGARACPYHFHHVQEEMFVILEGEGLLRVADEALPVRAGDVVFIPPGSEFPHHFQNNSSAPLKYLSISTQERPDVCEYPDSRKIAVFGAGQRFVQRRENSLDYWDGEGTTGG